MSALSARVAVVPGRNAIGIELPNQLAKRSTCAKCSLAGFRERRSSKLALCLGKTIGGEPVIAELARMPHLLVAGTTGSGKSVAINTMILSLLYRLTPDECRLIMVDPKMLELSVYDGIPHLLTPVVTDPKKAVVALKWAVREMEDRYRKMSKLGVRNIDGFNARVVEAQEEGETITRTVQTGFDRETGEPMFENEAMELDAAALHRRHRRRDGRPDDGRGQGDRRRGPASRADGARRRHSRHHGDAAPVGRRHHRHDQGELPDAHLVPGDVEDRQPHHPRRAGRRAAARPGRHALHGRRRTHHAACTARSSPTTRSRSVVAHLKRQGEPRLSRSGHRRGATRRAMPRRSSTRASSAPARATSTTRPSKSCCATRRPRTSYIQRRLQIGYNRAASLMERMEKEGIVGPANHVGKREILIETPAGDED